MSRGVVGPTELLLDPNPRSGRHYWSIPDAPLRVLLYWRNYATSESLRESVLQELAKRRMT